MSTYTHRYVEVLREKIDGYRWKFEKLPDPETVVGKVYKINEHNLPEGIHRYYESVKETNDTPARWVGKDRVDSVWTPIRWYFEKSDIDQGENPYEEQWEAKRNDFRAEDKFGRKLHLQEGLMWCNNGGHIRDDYVGRGWGDTVFQERGFPDGVSDAVKKDIEDDYHYGVTYVTLSEWEKLYDKEYEKFVSEVKKRFRDEKLDEVLERLNILLYDKTLDKKYAAKKKTKEDDDLMWEDSVDYMFEEELWRLYNIRMEIDRCEFIVEELGNCYEGGDKVRIIYYLA